MREKISTEQLLENLRSGAAFPRADQIRLVLRLSIPTILAQLSSIIMSYIDTAMVGRLGTNSSASIGLVSTTVWLLHGLCTCLTVGFAVIAAQKLGAGERSETLHVLHQAMEVTLSIALLIGIIGALLSPFLPGWLGGERALHRDSSVYLMIVALSLPFFEANYLGGAMLRSYGSMKLTGMVQILICVLDVIFNYFLIFGGGNLVLGRLHLFLPGAGLGVAGAALGTALSIAVGAIILTIAAHRTATRIQGDRGHFPERPDTALIRRAVRISLPVLGERIVMNGAYLATTRIISPLGAVPLMAHSFAITAESFCYMPGYGIGEAAQTMVGQSVGAGRTDMARHLSWLSVALGSFLMACTGVMLYFGSPYIFSFLTPVSEAQALGVRILRIEAFAEPLYGASIIASGALRGIGDTLVPALLNLVSMWGVRILLSVLLVPVFGLPGAWIAMATELCVRGIILCIRLLRVKWKRIGSV